MIYPVPRGVKVVLHGSTSALLGRCCPPGTDVRCVYIHLRHNGFSLPLCRVGLVGRLAREPGWTRSPNWPFE